jgi:mRNA interferase MazF
MVSDFDEVIGPEDEDFSSSRLATKSLIRLGYLSTVPLSEIKGQLGFVSQSRATRLLRRLADFLEQAAAKSG